MYLNKVMFCSVLTTFWKYLFTRLTVRSLSKPSVISHFGFEHYLFLAVAHLFLHLHKFVCVGPPGKKSEDGSLEEVHLSRVMRKLLFWVLTVLDA